MVFQPNLTSPEFNSSLAGRKLLVEGAAPADLFQQQPPAFGHTKLKEYFPLDLDYIHLNHGGYGTAPWVVHKVESNLSPKMVNVQRDELVLVQNTTGINTVLRNFEWEEGDLLSSAYWIPAAEFTLNMVNIELPFLANIPGSSKVDSLLMKKMLYERNAYSAHFYHNGRWWTRCSAQVYNEIQDFERLAKIWVEVCDEAKREIEADGKGQ
ncbi:hypothetical protein D9756_003265 [Leucocoprinus leucothites]|uniref:Uncharacterized protein n=1 Tax=Leucocoprinus leucothites TaxID=201217 RepID=A0A8H5LJL9_9AGAR|nr:hypothetical protein D9756_003265 [Leucoagaricus leucothites]